MLWQCVDCVKEVIVVRCVEKEIMITQEDSEFLSELLSMTGEEIYNKYGLKENETIVRTCDFGDGVEVDIKLVVCDENSRPYTEGVAFKNGFQFSYTEPEDEFAGEWCFEDEEHDVEYVVNISVEKVKDRSQSIVDFKKVDVTVIEGTSVKSNGEQTGNAFQDYLLGFDVERAIVEAVDAMKYVCCTDFHYPSCCKSGDKKEFYRSVAYELPEGEYNSFYDDDIAEQLNSESIIFIKIDGVDYAVRSEDINGYTEGVSFTSDEINGFSTWEEVYEYLEHKYLESNKTVENIISSAQERSEQGVNAKNSFEVEYERE